MIVKTLGDCSKRILADSVKASVLQLKLEPHLRLVPQLTLVPQLSLYPHLIPLDQYSYLELTRFINTICFKYL